MSAQISFDGVTVSYGAKVALSKIHVEIPERQIFALIGPANAGKTTFLKCINRTVELAPEGRVQGQVKLGGVGVDKLPSVQALRRRVGMVFPLPVGLPLSVYDNVAYAPRMSVVKAKVELDEIVERCLRQAALWDEVKDRLDLLGTRLSGGQQQRLTIARALSHDPEVLCLDEFSIAVDPVTTMRIEDVLTELKSRMTIVLATNLVQQARRLADRVAFFNAGRLIEEDETERIFSDQPRQAMTLDYVRGNFG